MAYGKHKWTGPVKKNICWTLLTTFVDGLIILSMPTAHTGSQTMTAAPKRTPFVQTQAVTPIIVAVWTDGHGSFQARCTNCGWVSPWQEHGSKSQREPKAVKLAKEHGAEHADNGGKA